MVRAVLLVMCLVVLLSAAAYAVDMKDIQIHGFMRNRFYANPDSSARFTTEEISLVTKAKVSGYSETYVEIYYHPQVPSPGAEQYRPYVESAYYDTQLGSGHFRIGKGR